MMMTRLIHMLMLSLVLLVLVGNAAFAEDAPTYAERLGFPKGTRAVIFHNDDAGLCHEANLASFRGWKEGLITSWSVMMPCPWIIEVRDFMRENPDACSGLHLTLTNEWKQYRWRPVSCAKDNPGLVDEDGFQWGNVRQVRENATVEEYEAEIRAQIALAEKIGLPISHLDTHMGTVFATDAFFERYVAIGIEKQIPILLPAGHMTLLETEEPELMKQSETIRTIGEAMWASGLAVIDDAHTSSYSWKTTDKRAQFTELIKSLKPGITHVILHATVPSENFDAISTSGVTREGDLNAMLDPGLKALIEEEGIVLTSWKEIQERRNALK
ncbi:MAG: ChbG/HpnK family deacetylase [Candidatus Hydrogenedens sp.]|nr:ChbG/HpnK family deacetylase [Candidatus Hydrogenedens sp.]